MTRNPTGHDQEQLSADFLLSAYRRGWFPMADPATRRIAWFSPDPRSIIPLDGLHVSRTLAREVRRARFEIRVDSAFREVVRACAEPRADDDQSWIDDRFVTAYTALHRAGHAHSVEAWLEGRLVGGLYGVRLGQAFCGESMFCRPALGGANASKVCLVHLVDRLRRGGFTLLDTQFINPHMARLGSIEIPRQQYLDRLARAIRGSASFVGSGT